MIRPVVPAIIVVVGTAVVGPTTGRMVSGVPGSVSVVGGAAGGASGARALPVSVRGAAAVGVAEACGSRALLVRRGVAVAAGSGGALPVGVRLAAAPGVRVGGGPVIVGRCAAPGVRMRPGRNPTAWEHPEHKAHEANNDVPDVVFHDVLYLLTGFWVLGWWRAEPWMACPSPVASRPAEAAAPAGRT